MHRKAVKLKPTRAFEWHEVRLAHSQPLRHAVQVKVLLGDSQGDLGR